MPTDGAEPAERPEGDLPAGSAGGNMEEPPGLLAGGLEGGEGVAGALRNAVAILEGVLRDAPTTAAESAA